MQAVRIDTRGPNAKVFVSITVISVAMKSNPLEGQVALVTGAAKRIGRSIALRLAADGADIIVNYLSSKADAESLVREIVSSGRRAVAVRADVSRRPEVAQLFAEAENKFGRLDILVNNAGTFFPAKFEDLTDEQWDRIMNAQFEIAIPVRASRCAFDETPGARPHRQPVIARRPSRVAFLHALLRFQGRRNHAHTLPCSRARARDFGE